MRWFSSDTHFGHSAIIEYCGRPVHSVEDMTTFLVNNFNKLVKPEDTLYLLGDFAFMGTTRATEILKTMNGSKILVKGNHDDVRTLEKAQRMGFTDLIFNGQVKIGSYDVNLSHFPYIGDHTEEERYKHLRPKDNGNWLLHGHVHQEWKINRYPKMINVGVDVWDYHPINEYDVISIIEGRL